MLRTLFKSDVEKLLAIEESVHVTPWTEETFRSCFEAGYVGWVAEEDKHTIIGFIVIAMKKEECHILNLCVAKAFQRKGFGSLLLNKALRHAKEQGLGLAYLEVRRSNRPAIALYQKMQFHLVGERKDYYPTVNGHEDALIFARSCS